jgi:hypothetical protein
MLARLPIAGSLRAAIGALFATPPLILGLTIGGRVLLRSL